MRSAAEVEGAERLIRSRFIVRRYLLMKRSAERVVQTNWKAYMIGVKDKVGPVISEILS